MTETRTELGIQIMSPQRIQIPHKTTLEDMPDNNHYYNMARIKSQQSQSNNRMPFWITWLIISIIIGLIIK